MGLGTRGARHRPCILKRALIAVSAVLMIVAGYAGAHAAPLVVASIKPVHALLAAVMTGVGAPILLVEGAASPHAYSLKPSQARVLQQADVIVWVGAEVETFLQRPIATLGATARVVMLTAAAGLEKLPPRRGGVFEHPTAHGVGGDDDVQAV